MSDLGKGKATVANRWQFVEPQLSESCQGSLSGI
jgi:hypothetical protein